MGESSLCPSVQSCRSPMTVRARLEKQQGIVRSALGIRRMYLGLLVSYIKVTYESRGVSRGCVASSASRSVHLQTNPRINIGINPITSTITTTTIIIIFITPAQAFQLQSGKPTTTHHLFNLCSMPLRKDKRQRRTIRTAK